MVNGRASRQIADPLVLVGIVSDDGDSLHALFPHLPGHDRNGQLAVDRLAAGHGDGVVE